MQYIDILKAVAIMGVVLVHFNNSWPAPMSIFNKVAAIGARCPQFFFVISAYLICFSITRNPNFIILDFYKKRIFRLAPLYYASLVISVIIPTLKILDFSILDYISHFLFLNGLNPYWINSIIGPEWYIADLALFYLITPVILKYAKSLKKSVIMLVMTLVISCIVLMISNNTVLLDSNDAIMERYFHTFFFIHQLPVWMIGICLFYLVNEIKGRQVFILSTVVYLLVTICVLVLYISFHLNKVYITSSFIAGMIFGLVFLLLSKAEVLSNSLFKPLAFIGKHSFGIYCFHQILINCIFSVVKSEGGIFEWGICFATTLLISILTGCIVESLEQRIRIKSNVHT